MEKAGVAIRVQGVFYAADSSQRNAAALFAQGDWAEICSPKGEILSRAPRKMLQIDAPIGSAARKVTFPDGGLFESDDHPGIEALAGPSGGGMLHRYEAFGPRLLLVMGICLAGAWAIWRYGLDMLVAVAIWATPPCRIDKNRQGQLANHRFVHGRKQPPVRARSPKGAGYFRQIVGSLTPRCGGGP